LRFGAGGAGSTHPSPGLCPLYPIVLLFRAFDFGSESNPKYQFVLKVGQGGKTLAEPGTKYRYWANRENGKPK
jgi:hypothetical protein